MNYNDVIHRLQLLIPQTSPQQLLLLNTRCFPTRLCCLRIPHAYLNPVEPPTRNQSVGNGSRQYMYPDPSTYITADPKTGELLSIDKKTIVVPLATGTKKETKYEAVKYGQEYPHDGPKWTGYYGRRNTVESQNAYIKDTATEGIEDPRKRRARGNTFASLAVTMAVVTANVRRILIFIRETLAKVSITSKNRAFASSYYAGEDLSTIHTTQGASAPPPGN